MYTRDRRASSFIELSAGLIVVIPIILACFDFGTIYMGQQMNTDICREAARTAAAGPPSAIMSNEPAKRVQRIVYGNVKHKGAIQFEPKTTVTENISQLPQAPFGGQVNGIVTVQTTADVYPPFLVGKVIGKGPIVLNASQTYPFTWTMQNSVVVNNSVGPSSTSGGGIKGQVGPSTNGGPMTAMSHPAAGSSSGASSSSSSGTVTVTVVTPTSP